MSLKHYCLGKVILTPVEKGDMAWVDLYKEESL